MTRSLKPARLVIPLAVLATAAFTVYLAWPRLHASLLFLPVDTAIANYWKNGEIAAEQQEGLRQRARGVIDIYPHYRYWDNLSLLEYLQGIDPANSLYERRMALEQSIVSAASSLRRAPARPRPWLRIANARAWLSYPAADVVEPLLMAVYTGRVDPPLMVSRLGLGLRYLADMDEEGQGVMRDQVLLTWQMQPRDLANAIKDRDIVMGSLEYLLEPAHKSELQAIRESVDGAVR